jgi:hypothetical protein
MAFVKIDREILNSYCFSNPNHFKIWIWMLVKANYKKSFVPINLGNGISTVEIDRGQFIFGRFKAEEELNLDGSLIYRALKKFEELGQVKLESNNRYTVITICKYDDYQSNIDSNRTADEKPEKNQRKTSEKLANTSKEFLEDKEYKELLLANFKNLPNEMINSIKIKLNITKGIDLENQKIESLWECFKFESNQNKKYKNENEAYKHFSNWVNLQDFKKTNFNNTNQNVKITGVKFSDDKQAVYFPDGTSQKLGESQLSLVMSNMTNPSQIVKGLIY